MKYMRQFAIILAVSCAGEILKYFLPFPIPASIYGLVIMLLLLITKKIRLESVKGAGEFLVEIMPVMFIPAGVGLLVSWEQVQSVIVPVCVITVVSTVLVMIVTGKVTDYMIDRKKEEEE